jgi:hypothetical protein
MKKIQLSNLLRRGKLNNMKYNESFKKMSIVLVPDSTSGIKQFRLPTIMLPILTLFLIATSVYVFRVFLDYHTIKTQVNRLAQLEIENGEQKRYLFFLAKRIDHIRIKMNEIEAPVHAAKAVMNGGTYDDVIQILEEGGLNSGIVLADYSMAKNHQEIVRLMHRSLDNLNDDIETIKVKVIEQARLQQVKIEQYKEESVYAQKSTRLGKKEEIRNQLKAIANELGLEPRLALGMAKVESGYNPESVSPKGAVGVLQVMPRLAWHNFGIAREKLFDPQVNIRIGLSWMKSLLNRFDHDLDLSLAAYNAGVSRVVRAGYRIPRIRETQMYVRRVKKAMKEGV